MSWPLRYRTLSFAVTLGVTSGEFLVLGLPIALIVHFARLATIGRIAAIMVTLCALWSFGIAIYGHIWPPAAPHEPRHQTDLNKE
jgi:hypothetical protein